MDPRILKLNEQLSTLALESSHYRLLCSRLQLIGFICTTACGLCAWFNFWIAFTVLLALSMVIIDVTLWLMNKHAKAVDDMAGIQMEIMVIQWCQSHPPPQESTTYHHKSIDLTPLSGYFDLGAD